MYVQELHLIEMSPVPVPAQNSTASRHFLFIVLPFHAPKNLPKQQQE